jgi:hypothetical protein
MPRRTSPPTAFAGERARRRELHDARKGRQGGVRRDAIDSHGALAIVDDQHRLMWRAGMSRTPGLLRPHDQESRRPRSRNVRDDRREANDVLDRAGAGESMRTPQNLGRR